MKLSELLAKAAEDSEGLGYEVSCGRSEYMERGRTLRAIAPALVRAIADIEHAEQHGWHDHQGGCAGCTLLAAMKEAGVSCE